MNTKCFSSKEFSCIIKGTKNRTSNTLGHLEDEDEPLIQDNDNEDKEHHDEEEEQQEQGQQQQAVAPTPKKRKVSEGPNSKKKHRGAGRGAGYSTAGVQHLLHCAYQVIPVGSEDLEEVPEPVASS